ncbi:MAG: hypothetical protein IPP71_02950 [Bacteroidetes bacterium]|nr:hypothetical protein [Bacteroidota bacterium]
MLYKEVAMEVNCMEVVMGDPEWDQLEKLLHGHHQGVKQKITIRINR